ncbi:ATP-binding protein [Patescibacteria group bacterium AH-259-L05]|nr:ATP-binding protein [Patescibacteria group bacterium AH-259-L05]
MVYVPRDIEKQITPFLKRKEALALIGPRQAGKTTLLLQLKNALEKKGKTVAYITFEKRSDLELFQDSIDDFKDMHKESDVIIIDEFHYVEEGGQKLKYLYDTTKSKFIISGSSSLELTFQTGKFMVGRLIHFRLWPFSFKEYVRFQDPKMYTMLEKRIPSLIHIKTTNNCSLSKPINSQLQKYFEEYLIFGGYPAVVLANDANQKKKLLESLLHTYLLRDIKSLLDLTTENELIKLVKLLATQVGSLINYTELTNSCGLKFHNLKKHLTILEQTYIISLLQPYFTNKRVEVVKNPKVYFIDTGFRNLSIDNFNKLDTREDRGSLVENFVFRVLAENYAGLSGVRFWRTKSKAEVDFVLELQTNIIPVEVRYSSKPVIGKSFYSFINKFSPEKGFIITKDYTGEIKAGKTRIIFVPCFYL